MQKSKEILSINFADFLANSKNISVVGEELILNYAKLVLNSISNGGKIFWCGNGGSAAESQHMAAELMGRFNFDRSPIASLALTTDTSFITGVSNDLDFNQIFARQISALGQSGDLLIAISTSGNSQNVISAVEEAKRKGMFSVGLLGSGGGKIAKLVDYPIIINSSVTPRIQEVHTFINHCMCEIVEYDLNEV
jgi:D-sedoheptulose 7-phosphate isomerase